MLLENLKNKKHMLNEKCLYIEIKNRSKNTLTEKLNISDIFNVIFSLPATNPGFFCFYEKLLYCQMLLILSISLTADISSAELRYYRPLGYSHCGIQALWDTCIVGYRHCGIQALRDTGIVGYRHCEAPETSDWG